MFVWLKDKTFGRLQRWLSEKVARAYQKSHTQRLQKMVEQLPEEFVEISKKLEILNGNSWANHHLYKKAKGNKKYQEAFQYFFYGFELNLKYCIMSEMAMVNFSKAMENKNPRMFSFYSSAQICKVQELGDMSELIKKFCHLHGDRISKELWQINKERNFIIHNMMKKKLTEKEIKEAFEDFFIKNNDAIIKAYSFFDAIFAERPSKILKKMEDVSRFD